MANDPNQPRVILKVGPYKKILALVRQGLSSGAPVENPIRKMVIRWAARYSTFIRRRFIEYSKGNGNWPPLAESTIRRRRDGRSKKQKAAGVPRKVAILVNTGMLRDSLEIGKPGNVVRMTDDGVLFGIGAVPHPGGKPTLGQIALWHNAGAGRLPRRQIIVGPDERTQAGMRADAQLAFTELKQQAGTS